MLSDHKLMTLSREYHFSAGHSIRDAVYVKCRSPHGHNYKVLVNLTLTYSGALTKTGFYIDFVELDSYVKPLIEKLDHTNLVNTLGENASAEALAEYLMENIDWNSVTKIIKERGGSPSMVTVGVYENERSYVTVSRVVGDCDD